MARPSIPTLHLNKSKSAFPFPSVRFRTQNQIEPQPTIERGKLSLCDLRIANASFLLSARRRLLGFWHAGLPSVLAALILFSLHVVFVRHGRLLNSRLGL